MCDCGIKYLFEGKKKLKEILNESDYIYDYIYIKCSCGVNKECIGEEFIFCTKCEKYFCDECNFELVYDINNSSICECKKSNKYFLHKDHYYCNKCKLQKCSSCSEECPKCYKTIIYNDESYCEDCYEIEKIIS